MSGTPAVLDAALHHWHIAHGAIWNVIRMPFARERVYG